MESNSFVRMRSDRKSFIELLEYITDSFSDPEIFCSDHEFSLIPPGVSPFHDARLDLVLSGRKHMQFPENGAIRNIIMPEQSIHYCAPMTWKKPLWDSLHEMSSIIYNPQFIRITYINYDEISYKYEHAGADIFYHTPSPLSDSGQAVLRAINLHVAGQKNPKVLSHLINALLFLTLDNFKNSDNAIMSRKDHRRLQIEQYLHEHFQEAITRDSVARHFRLNPRYVSHLFGETDGFNATIRKLRMEYAAALLCSTDFTIDEITLHCGYSSSTFFIAAFKKLYGIPPGEFRKRNKKA